MSQTTTVQALFDALQALMRGLKMAEANGAESVCSRLPPSDFQALMLVGERHRCIVSDVANGLNISPTTASSLVDRLVRNGFVERYRTDDDRRIVRLELTGEGARIRTEAMAMQLEHCRRMLDQLSADEAAAFLRLTQKIGSGLNQPELAEPIRAAAQARATAAAE